MTAAAAAAGAVEDGAGRLSAPMVAALERTWEAIRARHLEVPPAVVVVASGSDRGGMRKLGHFGALRWRQAAGGDDPSEVMVSGEGLGRRPVEVLGTLLHEAAHALAHVRGVQDTSRQGRYHNRRYAALAAELGLDVAELAGFGLAATAVPDPVAAAYAGMVDQLRAALILHRRAEASAGGAGAGRKRASSNNPLPCGCGCPRRIRVAATVLAAGPIVCGVCDEEFLPEGEGEVGDR